MGHAGLCVDDAVRCPSEAHRNADRLAGGKDSTGRQIHRVHLSEGVVEHHDVARNGRRIGHDHGPAGQFHGPGHLARRRDDRGDTTALVDEDQRTARDSGRHRFLEAARHRRFPHSSSVRNGEGLHSPFISTAGAEYQQVTDVGRYAGVPTEHGAPADLAGRRVEDSECHVLTVGRFERRRAAAIVCGPPTAGRTVDVNGPPGRTGHAIESDDPTELRCDDGNLRAAGVHESDGAASVGGTVDVDAPPRGTRTAVQRFESVDRRDHHRVPIDGEVRLRIFDVGVPALTAGIRIEVGHLVRPDDERILAVNEQCGGVRRQVVRPHVGEVLGMPRRKRILAPDPRPGGEEGTGPVRCSEDPEAGDRHNGGEPDGAPNDQVPTSRKFGPGPRTRRCRSGSSRYGRAGNGFDVPIDGHGQDLHVLLVFGWMDCG